MAAALELWHDIVRTGDVSALDRLLDDAVIFESPVVHTPQAGKALTAGYLRAAMLVLNNGRFSYLNEWVGPASAVLEFTTDVDGIAINGVDIISWNEAGRITHFKVMVRPLKAITILHQKMGELLAAAAHPPR
jgi:hypothetical protein